MLGTRERTLLLENLRPPAGYRLRRAVGTSFTLDLMALLTAPLAFTFFDAHDEDGAPLADPVALLEALRRHAEKVTLFCQAGAIGVPSPDQTLLAYLERSVIEVKPERAGGIFHPKVWVLNFESDEAPDVYRVLCLSRNLTFARAWDTCLRLEGAFTEGGDNPRNEPFADLLLALPRLAIRQPVRDELREDIGRMADEIRRVDFKPPRPFTDFRVHNLGLNGNHAWPFPKARRSLVVSPFLVGSTVRDLLRDHGLEVLISRPEAFAEVVRREVRKETGRCRPPSSQDVFERKVREALPRTCYVLSPGAALDARDTQKDYVLSPGTAFDARRAEEEGEEQPDRPPTVDDVIELAGIHAKLFLFENGPETRLFTGSANATGAAFHGNVEVLVELVGKTRGCGIDAFLGLEEDPRLETLRSILQEYQPQPPGCTEPEPCDKLEREADRLVRLFAAVPFTATLQDVDAQQLWDMTLSGGLPEMPDGAQVKVWPATLPSKEALRVDGPANTIATFRRVSFEGLTAFFAFEVLLRKEQCEVRQRFVVAAALVGAPEDRRERLLRSLLQDRHRVLQLLFLILMGEGADVLPFVQAVRRDSTNTPEPIGGWHRGTLLEALLRSLSRNPRQIDDVARLISDLDRTPEGRDLLPEGLNEIWEPVWAAREALRS